MKSNPPLPSLLLAACTLFPSTAAAGDPIELVFNGQIDEIYNYGTLPCPFCFLEVGDPYVISFLVDSPNVSTQGNVYRIYEASITVRDQTFTTWTTVLSIGRGQTYDFISFDAWLPYEWDWDGQVALFMVANLPPGATSGIGDLTCATVTELMNIATSTYGGVFRPDDESASGPFTLTSCQILPCQAWHCPADFNCDGGVDGTDVQDFFEQWEAGNSQADVNRDGATGPSDVEFFFLLWESNECSFPPPL